MSKIKHACLYFLLAPMLVLASIMAPSKANAIEVDGFSCELNKVFISRSNALNTAMTFDSIDIDTGAPYSFTNLIPEGIIPFRTNAIAYDSATGYIYGMNFVNGANNPAAITNMVEIKDDGGPGTTVLDVNAALNAFGYPELDKTDPASAVYTSIRSPGGEIYNGTYYLIVDTQLNDSPGVGQFTGETYLVAIDLTSFTIESVDQLSFTNFTMPPAGTEEDRFGDPYVGDIAIDAYTGIGYIFERNSQQLAEVDLSNGDVTVLGPNYISTVEPIIGGGLMITGDRQLFIFGASDLTVSLEQDSLYSANKTTGVLTELGTLEDAGISDGTACNTPDGRLNIVKSVTQTATSPTATAEITYTLTNSNPEVQFFDIQLDDVLPSGLTYIPNSLNVTGPGGWTAAPYNGLTNLQITGLVIPPGSSITVTIDALVTQAATVNTIANISNLPIAYGGPVRSSNTLSVALAAASGATGELAATGINIYAPLISGISLILAAVYLTVHKRAF